MQQGSSFGGISDTLRYYEFQLDSYSAYTAQTSQYTRENWPVFSIGGKKPLTTIAAIKILEVQIPFVYYIFKTGNNTFGLTEDGEALTTVTIPVGTYTVTQMLTVLATALSLASAATGVSNVYTVTYDSTSLKMSIYNNSATTLPFVLTFGTGTSDQGLTNPRRYLGFPGGTTTSQTFVAVGPANHGNVLLCPNVINMSGPNYIFVNSARLGNLVDQYLPTLQPNYSNSGPQMAKIPVNTNWPGIIDWADPDPEKWFNMESLHQLDDIDFYLTLGDSPDVMDLNGQSFTVKLGVLEQVSTVGKTNTGSMENRSIKRVRRN